jgi:hypothetical protein
MLIDCETCSVRGTGCSDCVISLFLGADEASGLDAAERRALSVLADAGLAPPLRLVPLTRPEPAGPPGDVAAAAG